MFQRNELREYYFVRIHPTHEGIIYCIYIYIYFGCQVSRFDLESPGLDLQIHTEESSFSSHCKFQVLGLEKKVAKKFLVGVKRKGQKIFDFRSHIRTPYD